MAEGILQNKEDQDLCPHEFYNKDMKLESSLKEQPDGTWKCYLCGQSFKTKEEATAE